ncbi:MAG: tRNA (guanosine(46)-N7)-methyltransferase TrmB [Mycoplasmataceae bacterium]|nr:tRNA (guanosine(46)-N7)-methyltransferase TrmB [Mycoplasmataceae bacterium]
MGRIRKIKNAETLIKDYPQIISTLDKKNLANCLEVEIGSGKGNFLINKAINNPTITYIGVERDSTILLKALRKLDLLITKPSNLFFIHGDVIDICKWFNRNSVSIFYLNFPDPWPKKRHEKKRLTNNAYLKLYYDLLIKNGTIEFKTDNLGLYEYSLDSLRSFRKLQIQYKTIDMYSDLDRLKNNIQTEYEQKFVHQNIKIKKIELIKN